tara:strand:+ start:13650 stop:14033 length:384 start_codon:yes stop_codon:yes gene_type:complete
MAEATQPSGSWTDAFPAPRTTAPILTREEALSDLSSPDLLIVDVRRTDYEGGTIKGSINLPAHSFYMNRAVLHDLCKRAGVKKVAFYCGRYNFGNSRVGVGEHNLWCRRGVSNFTSPNLDNMLYHIT